MNWIYFCKNFLLHFRLLRDILLSFQDFVFSITSCLSYIILGFIEAYYSTGAWAHNCNDVGSDGAIHNHCQTIYEWVFASVTILFSIFF